MFENIQWDKPVKTFPTYDRHIIGIIVLAKNVTFEIEKQVVWERGYPNFVKFRYSVSYDIDGNTSGGIYDTKEEVLAYLNNQLSHLPEYIALVAKREALVKRIIPLHNKCSRYAEQIHKLAKS